MDKMNSAGPADHMRAPWGLSATKGTLHSTFLTCCHLLAKPSFLVTMWPIPELELSHIKPTPQHRTKSALCAPEPHTETWSHGHEAMGRQIADAFGQCEHQRSLIHNSLQYSTQKIRKRVVLFTDSCDCWVISQITAVIVQWGETCRIQWRPRSPWPSSELHTTHLVLAGEYC